MFIPSLCMILSYLFNVPFYVLMKMPAFFSDIMIAGVIYLVLLKIVPKKAYFWGILYALNPVSILISAFHGNIMPFPTLLMFLAYIVLLYGVDRNYRLSALLLGLSIGIRGFSALLLPLFLLKLKLSAKKKWEYFGYAVIPTVISFVPFLILDFNSVCREVFAYSGWTDYGFISIIRVIYSLKIQSIVYNLPNGLHLLLLQASKLFFLIFYVFIICILFKKKKLIDLILIVFTSFYFIYGGVASQYFIWILPFAFLTRDRFLKYFLVFCSFALINFYYIYHPKILFGNLNIIRLPLRNFVLSELISLTILWLFFGYWLVVLIRKKRDNEIFI